jgi:hypothetical protein
MSVWVLAEVVGRILLLVGVGVALRMSGLLPRSAAATLNTLLIWVAIPALVWTAIRPATLTWALAGIVAVAWVVALAGIAVAWVLGRYAFKLQRATLGAFVLVAGLGNTGYLGYPISVALFGQPGLSRAVFYDVFGTVGVLLTVGLLVAYRFGENADGVSPWREVLGFPVLLVAIAAIALKPVPVPILVSDAIDSLAKMTVPLIMISLGLTLDFSKVRSHLANSAAAGAIKLVALPLLAWGLALVVLHDPLPIRIAVLEAGMPSMMLALVVAARFGLDTEFAASAIMLTTAASIVTLPLLMLVIR